MTAQVQYSERASKSFAWNHFQKLVEFGFINIFNMMIARYYGPEGSVPYVVFTALCTSISILAAFGVDGILLRFLPRLVESEHGGSETLHAIGVTGIRSFVRRLFAFRMIAVGFCLLLVALLFIVLPIFSDSLSDSLGSIRRYAPLIMLFLAAQAVVAFSTFALIALMRTKQLFLYTIMGRAILPIGIILLYTTQFVTIDIAVGLYTSSTVCMALMLGILLYKSVHSLERRRNVSPSFAVSSIVNEITLFLKSPASIKAFTVTPLMLYGLATWGNDVLSTVLGRQPDILMIRAFYGENSAKVGLYNVTSLVLVFTEYIFMLGFGGMLVSVLSKLAHDDETQPTAIRYERMSKARRQVASFQAILYLPLAGFMTVFTAEFITAIFGTKYLDAVPMIHIGIILLVLNIGFFGGGLQTTSLVAVGKERIVLKNRIFWGIVNLIGNLYLIHHFGAVGAVVGTNTANLFSCAVEEYFARKYIGISIQYLSVIRLIVISGISAIGASFIVTLFGITNIYLLLFTGGIVLGIIMYLLCRVLNIPEYLILIERIKRML
jgi:O-antigen/teichoic acid export membrane protein